MGIEKMDVFGLSWESRQTAQDVSQANHDLPDATAALEKLANDPKYKDNPVLQESIKKLRSAEDSIVSADGLLKTAVQRQQTSVEKQTPVVSATEGWIFLGRVDENKQKWKVANARPETGGDFPQLSPGQELVLTDRVYLRSAASPGSRASGPILDVIPAGTKVEVVDVDTQSHALAGGWFVWANVKVKSAAG